MISGTIKTLVVDDSPFMRQLISEILSSAPGIEVVGQAADPFEARALIKQLNPDVLTLDVEMPKMNGLKFLENLMRLRPMPVVMVSTLTEVGASTTMEALALGAVDFLPKPKVDVAKGLEAAAQELVEKVRGAAAAKVRARTHFAAPAAPAEAPRHAPKRKPSSRPRIVAIGASTGGTEAIREVLEGLWDGVAPVVIAQHIPAGFSAAFARRLDTVTPLRAHEAADGELLAPGHAYVAPGDAHLRVEESGAGLRARLSHDEKVNRHRPSVDVLMHSVAKAAGPAAVGVILTGMGADGAAGLLAMHAAGAATIAQDEATSLVYGMPREAALRGAAEVILPLGDIAAQLRAWVEGA
jgi:two-component system chemotaxis response regulator CheB